MSSFEPVRARIGVLGPRSIRKLRLNRIGPKPWDISGPVTRMDSVRFPRHSRTRSWASIEFRARPGKDRHSVPPIGP